MKSEDNRRFFITGHPEYDPETLANEYFRDLSKGEDQKLPAHYFPNDDPQQAPVVPVALPPPSCSTPTG